MTSIKKYRASEPQVVAGRDVGRQFDLPVDGDELWRLWLADKAETTRKNYGYDLKCFAEFAGKGSIGAAIDALLRCTGPEANKTVIAYQAWLYTAKLYAHGADPQTAQPVQVGYAPATVNRRIYALSSITELANLCGLVSWTLKVKLRAQETQRDTRGCGSEGYAAILQVVEAAVEAAPARGRETILARRDLCMMRLLHDAGLRRKETVGIEWPAGVRVQKNQVLIIGKGRKRLEWVYVGSRCMAAIQSYLEVRGIKPGYLLLSTHPAHQGRGLATSTVNRRVSFWARLAKTRVTPHGLRHTAATRALDETHGNRRIVAQWSRHRDPNSLGVYDDRRKGKLTEKIVDRIADPSTAMSDEELISAPSLEFTESE